MTDGTDDRDDRDVDPSEWLARQFQDADKAEDADGVVEPESEEPREPRPPIVPKLTNPLVSFFDDIARRSAARAEPSVPEPSVPEPSVPETSAAEPPAPLSEPSAPLPVAPVPPSAEQPVPPSPVEQPASPPPVEPPPVEPIPPAATTPASAGFVWGLRPTGSPSEPPTPKPAATPAPEPAATPAPVDALPEPSVPDPFVPDPSIPEPPVPDPFIPEPSVPEPPVPDLPETVAMPAVSAAAPELPVAPEPPTAAWPFAPEASAAPAAPVVPSRPPAPAEPAADSAIESLFFAPLAGEAAERAEWPDSGGKNGGSDREPPRERSRRETGTPLPRNQRVLLWVAGVVVGVLALAVLFLVGTKLAGPSDSSPVVAVSTTPAASATPTPTPSQTPVTAGPAAVGQHAWGDLRGGECLDPYQSPWAEKFTVVDCAAAHPAQMVFRGTFPDSTGATAYPGVEALQTQINLLCSAPSVIDFSAAGAYSDIQFQAAYAATEKEWASGYHDYFCFVSRSSGQPITGSVAAAHPAG
ncbi:MAG TPA: hypothetical protein VGC18_03675 [Lacisediminihabitans sp.]|uniref:hypothetical protein n=1 Tax=Lacisediminihabitans sp. TaxID=2787631 RepID=UPI002ED9E7D4